ncbi:hypothetical protein P3C58_32910, partial [Mesorhizobium sp. XAP10]
AEAKVRVGRGVPAVEGSTSMLAIIAGTLVLTTVVGGLITAFWIEARHDLHDPTPDRAMHLELLTRLGSPVSAESS